MSKIANLKLAGVVLLAGLLTAAATDPLSAQTTPKRGGTLVYAQCSGNRRGGDQSNTRHPYYMIDLITRSAYNTLTWVDEGLNIVLELATAITPADDTLKVWDVTVRDGVLFHDGRAVTARDWAASFELHRRKNFASQQITAIEVTGAHSLRF